MAAFTSFPQTLAANGTITVPVKPGRYMLKVSGTWGSGTVALTHDGQPLTDGTFTADTSKILELSEGTLVLTLSGSTSPSLLCALGSVSGRAASDT